MKFENDSVQRRQLRRFKRNRKHIKVEMLRIPNWYTVIMKILL
jgi:hypothetical protein